MSKTGKSKKIKKQQAKKTAGGKGSSVIPALLIVLAAIAADVVTMNFLVDRFKCITLIVCIGLAAAAIIAKGGFFRKRIGLASIALLFYVAFNGLALVWASAGKLFLYEYSKLLIAFAAYAAIVMFGKRSEKTVRTVAAVIVVMAAIYAVLSIDLGSSQFLLGLVNSIPGYVNIEKGFEAGTRLTGVFGNANTLSGALGIGVFLGIYLVGSAQNAKSRAVCTALLSFICFAFLMAFSMGGLATFAVGVLVYLAVAGEKRAAVLVRMLEAAIPTLIFVFAAFPFYNAANGSAMPLLIAAVNAAVSCVLELFVYPRIEGALEKSGKIAGIFIAAVFVAAAAYIAAGAMVTGSVSIGAGESLERSVYPAAGETVLNVSASGSVNAKITSQNMSEVMMHTNTVLYSGTADGAQFTVPEDSKVVYITFSAPDGAVIKSASLSGGESVKLGYKLLPGFIANRIQGLRSNENFVQRLVFFRDGLKLFKLSPIGGSGLGCFESGLSGIQDFYYTTKYVHNNYIQILADSGIIGFISYILAIAGFVWLLIRKAGKDKGEFAAVYPALWAVLVFVCCHAAVEVTMSAFEVMLPAMSVFGLINLCFGEREAEERPAAGGALMRWGIFAVYAVYAVLILMNIIASSYADAHRNSVDDLYSALPTAIALDRFETNDYYLSYIIYAPDSGDPAIEAKATEYASMLMERRSNSVHKVLIEFYARMGDYENSVEAAKKGAAFNRTNSDLWNSYFDIYRGYYTDSPEMYDGTGFGEKVLELYDLMQDCNEALMQPVTLSTDNAEFINQLNG